jgi:Domain of Unknown Function (DUF928)
MKKIFAVSISIISLTGTSLIPPSLVPSLQLEANAAETTQPKYRKGVFSGKGGPGKTIPGGKRGICPDVQIQPGAQLTAIAPSDDIGGSLSKTPYILIYSPYTFSPSKYKQPVYGELLVRGSSEAGGQVGGAVKVSLPMKPGLVKVQLTQPVEKNRAYSWSFTVKCSDSSTNPYVASTIYISPDDNLVAANQSFSQRQQAIAYAENGYWYDALPLLLQNQPMQKDDIQVFLKSGGLANLVEKIDTIQK